MCFLHGGGYVLLIGDNKVKGELDEALGQPYLGPTSQGLGTTAWGNQAALGKAGRHAPSKA